MKTLQIIMMLLFITSLNSQTLPTNSVHTQAGTVNAFTKVEPPAIFLYRNEPNTTSTATFIIEAPNSPDSIKKAINYAAKIWSYLIKSNQPIKIRVWWKNLEQGILGGTDSVQYYINFTNAPRENIFYPTSLAEALSDQNLNGTKPEFVISLNNNIPWYCDTVGNCPGGKYDLVTVFMHEIGHGLGFLPSFHCEQNGTGSYGIDFNGIKRPTIYDSACVYVHITKRRLTDNSFFQNPSNNLGDILKSGKIFFDEHNASYINNFNLPKLYAPNNWESGSSISHLDESLYPHGNSNSLMTPKTDYAEAIYSPGEIGLAMMQDLGWNINRIVTFTSPQGGERWAQGETYQIKWTDNKYGSISVNLFRKNPQLGTFEDIMNIGTLPSNIGTTNIYNWKIPTTLINGIYRFQVFI